MVIKITHRTNSLIPIKTTTKAESDGKRTSEKKDHNIAFTNTTQEFKDAFSAKVNILRPPLFLIMLTMLYPQILLAACPALNTTHPVKKMQQDNHSNRRSIEQDGKHNEKFIAQQGENNALALKQSGQDNLAGIVQGGDCNDSHVSQTGDNNQSMIKQIGSSNRIIIRQGN